MEIILNPKEKKEVSKIYKLLLKYGSSAKDAKDMLKKNYDYVAKTYKKSTPRDKTMALIGLQAMKDRRYFGESKAELYKLYSKAMKTMPGSPNQKKIKKQIDALRKKLGMDKKPIKLRSKSGMGTISHLGMPESYDFKKAHKKFKETGELPPHLKKLVKDLDKVKVKYKVKNIVVPGLEWMSKIGESIDEGKYEVYFDVGSPGLMSQTVNAKNAKEAAKMVARKLKGGAKLIRKVVKEGTCGYGVDGKLGEEPAGPHLIKKKKKFDLDEACQKGYMTHPTRKTKIMFGKRYRNCVKKEGVDTTVTLEQAGMIADNICVNCGSFTNENLRKWFSDRWVNIGKKKKGGGHPPCGTSGKKRGYAKCVPASKAARMTKKQKASATRRKRAAQNKKGRGGTSSLKGGGKKPIYVSTKPKK